MDQKHTYEEIRAAMLEEIRRQMDMNREMSDEEIGSLIDETIMGQSHETYLGTLTKLSLRQDLFNSIRRLGLLQELVDDREVTEIMVNGPDHIFYEKGGRIYSWNKAFESKEKLEDIIQQIVARSGRYVNEASPIVDARLLDGSRVNVVLNPAALNGPILTIRKFPDKPISMNDLIRWQSITPQAASCLQTLVLAGYNIFISGATSTGKTTFLNVLANYIPKDARIITIEDSAELQLHRAENLVRLEARQASSGTEEAVSIRDLIRASLRMRPDRIIVGEVRGAEALDMIQAMNTGHDGSISTGHANSPEDMLARLETMILMGSEMPLRAIRGQIASSIDIIIQLGRLRDHSRRVIEITELTGCSEEGYFLNPLFRFQEEAPEKETPPAQDNGNSHPAKSSRRPAAILRENAGPFSGRSAVSAVSAGKSAGSRVKGSLSRTGNRLHDRRKLLSAALELTEI